MDVISPLGPRIQVTGVEFALQHHQAERIARQLGIQALAAAGVQHAKQGFKPELKVRFAAAKNIQG